MKIRRIRNNQQSYKGLHTDKLSVFHYNYLKPCIPEMQKLAKKTDIYLKSRWNPHFQVEILEYAIKPLNTATIDKNILRWGCLGTGYTKIEPKIIIDKIIAEIKKV